MTRCILQPLDFPRARHLEPAPARGVMFRLEPAEDDALVVRIGPELPGLLQHRDEFAFTAVDAGLPLFVLPEPAIRQIIDVLLIFAIETAPLIHGGIERLDLLVELDEPTFDTFMDLVFFLEGLLGTKVDLVTTRALSPHIAPYVEREVVWV